MNYETIQASNKELAPAVREHSEARTKEGTSLIDQSVQVEALPTYHLRGLGLYELHGEDILASYQGAGRYLVPSGTTRGLVHEVRVGRRPERSRCECTGFQHHGHCSHHVAAQRVARRSAVCDACGVRRWWTEVTEVQEEDELLAWFPMDVLCRARAPGRGI
jgi:hypothetical protein